VAHAPSKLQHQPNPTHKPTPTPIQNPSRSPQALGTFLRRKLVGWVRWIWNQEGTPGQRSRGLAAGVFMGCFPFFGLQTLLGMALASLVRGNHLLAAAGTWISNPFTYLPLYWFNYHLGCRFLGPGRGRPGADRLLDDSFWSLGWDFASRILLGSAVVGAVAATVAGKGCWLWLRHQRSQSSQ